MIVDTHAHLTLDRLREDLPAVLERARAAGVEAIITVGIDPADSRAAVALAQATPGVWATVGVHPHDVAELSEAVLDDLAALAGAEKVVGWGEIGLDYYRNRAPREMQRKWFREQLARARQLDLPVVIHDREAHAETLELLHEVAGSGWRGVFHCFSGDRAFARDVLALGFHLSVPGPVTYPKNEELRRVVAEMPLERLLLETDCPFLAPQPVRGKSCEPAHIVHTAAVVARVRGLEAADVARITTRASRDLFGVGETGEARIAYPIRRSLYLNVTGRCTNRCSFCAKQRGLLVKGHDLYLEREPTVAEMLAAVAAEGGAAAWDEVVFCGFGEPLLRLDAVLAVARGLRQAGARRLRVNTDGLASLVHGRDVTAELGAGVDALSVSLNAPDAATYERLCRPQVDGAYPALLEFVRRARETVAEVVVSVVTVPGLDLEACRKVAQELGVPLRLREYNEVG